MWRLCCPYLFLISSDASGGLCLRVVLRNCDISWTSSLIFFVLTAVMDCFIWQGFVLFGITGYFI